MKHMLKPVCIKVGLTLFAGACLCGEIQAHSLNGEKEDIAEFNLQMQQNSD